jgi:prolyl-tRNA synthetase
MGGSVSHEFLVAAPIGEDVVWVNKKNGQAIKEEEGKIPQGPDWERKIAIELGHIFQLGTKYSESLGALYLDEKGVQRPMIMGCYGIGVSRLIAAIIEVNNDAGGIMWPKEIAPFDVEILPLAHDEVTMGLAKTYYEELRASGLDVLLDDRDESAGRKFNDADLIGIPLRIIIGKRMLANNQVEIKIRRSGQVIAVDKDKVKEEILKLY